MEHFRNAGKIPEVRSIGVIKRSAIFVKTPATRYYEKKGCDCVTDRPWSSCVVVRKALFRCPGHTLSIEGPITRIQLILDLLLKIELGRSALFSITAHDKSKPTKTTTFT